MAALAAWLGTLLTPVFTYLATRFGERIALTIALLVAFAAIWGTFTTAIWGILSGISFSLPSELQVFFYFLPSGLPALLTARVSADLAAAVYIYARQNVMLKAGNP